MPAVVFDPAAFKARYPEFAAVADATLAACFTEAGLYLSNADNSPVQKLPRRALLLNMLTAHVAYIGGLLSADGTQRDAPSADALLPEVLGIDVPSARLPRWVQGAPEAGAQIRERDAVGRPQLVIDQGWRIDYLAYADDRPEALPARLDISRGDARIRLIIDSWTALP